MPYRKAPQSDTARLQALKAALTASQQPDSVLPTELATQLGTFAPQYETEMAEVSAALGAQVESTEQTTASGNQLRMVSRHFFQAFSNAVERGVFDANERSQYQLSPSDETLPNMDSTADAITWAERIVSGEAARVAAGLVAVPFPTAGEVETALNAFQQLRAAQVTALKAYDKELEDVEALRDGADALIRDVWDEVEYRFRKDSPASKRRKARLYGVVYVTRPGEEPDPDTPAEA